MVMRYHFLENANSSSLAGVGNLRLVGFTSPPLKHRFLKVSECPSKLRSCGVGEQNCETLCEALTECNGRLGTVLW